MTQPKGKEPAPPTKATDQLISRFAAVLGHNPTQGAKPTKSALDTVLEKIQEERRVQAEAVAETMTRELITALDKFEAQRRAFEAIEKKFTKEFSKGVARIEALANGQEFTEEESDKNSETIPI